MNKYIFVQSGLKLFLESSVLGLFLPEGLEELSDPSLSSRRPLSSVSVPDWEDLEHQPEEEDSGSATIGHKL